jgi:zinc protease
MTTNGDQRWTRDVRREVLPNGLTLLVQQEPAAPAVAVVTHVKAGFFDEPDRWSGISHVLEHMFFKGTPRRGVGAIARETKAAGGYLNASTTYDHTNYYTVLPSGSLSAALDIQSDALRNSLIDADELGRELQVIIQEAKRKLDNASAVTHETLHELMFDQHRIRRWRIGYEADLARLTRDDLWQYYRSRYVPERTIVAIVGSLDVDTALQLARRAYGDWPAAAGGVDRSPTEPKRSGVRARTLRADVAQAELVFGWRGAPPLDPAAPALDLAAAVLATGRGSRLYRALRESGLATYVYAHHYTPTELGVMTVGAELAPDRVDSVMTGIAEAVAMLAMAGPSEAELERARTLVLARWVRGIETTDGRASALAAAEALDGVGAMDREYAALESVTAAEVREAVAHYLRPEDVSAVLSLPHAEGDDLGAEQVSRAFAFTQLRAAPDPAIPVPVASAPVRTSARQEADVMHAALPGVDLLVRRKAGVPTVSLGLYLPRHNFDPPEAAGIGTLVVRSAMRGVAGGDAGQLAFAAEGLGGTLLPGLALDWLGWSTSVLSRHLGSAATLLSQLLTVPTLAEAPVLAERDLLVEETRQAADDMFRYPFQLAFREAFGPRGYGLPAQGLPEALAGVSADMVRQWHQQEFAGRRATVIAVGEVDAQEAIEILAGVYGGLPARAPSGPPPVEHWLATTEPRSFRVTRQKAQTAFAMIFPGPARGDPMHPVAEVWAAVASGLGGRLFEALRDKRSLAYTVMAMAWGRGRAGSLATYIATSPEREDEARQAMLEELARFVSQPVSAAELHQATSYLAGQAQVERQSSASLMAEILEAWMIGGGLAEVADPAARYRGVTAEQIQGLVARSLDPARRTEGVIQGSGGGR